MNMLLRVLVAALMLLWTAASQTAVLSEVDDIVVTLKRGNSNVSASALTEACAGILGCSMPLTEANCPGIKDFLKEKEAVTRESGTATYQCLYAHRTVVQFGPPPPPTCGDKPADEQQQVTCPAGTVGMWTQDKIWALQDYPTCWVQGEWTPSVPPAGMCPPADSDGDGVPDSMDVCPAVYAQTPDGCPATPSLLAAPTNLVATGISTSSIRITWNAVTGASAYSLERCIGATCTGFSQLICVTGLSAVHSTLPADLAVSYRMRASKDAVCGTGTDNLGLYTSPPVIGRTLSATPVDCVVSAWSNWIAGVWSTCYGGQQSRTETRTRTVMTQPVNGGTACPVLTETRTVAQTCGSEQPSLSWSPPTQNTDGSALTNLAGYMISYGASPSALAQTIPVTNPGVFTYAFQNLTPGTWYFVIRAYTTGDVLSDPSNIVSKTIQ